MKPVPVLAIGAALIIGSGIMIYDFGALAFASIGLALVAARVIMALLHRMTCRLCQTA